MRPWIATLLTTLLLVTPAAAETVRFRSTTWPPTPLQLRLAKTAGQTIAEQASVELAGALYRPVGIDERQGSEMRAVRNIDGGAPVARPGSRTCCRSRFRAGPGSDQTAGHGGIQGRIGHL